MGKHVRNILRGMGTVLEIAPDPHRETFTPLYRNRGESAEHAIYRTWRSVGDCLIEASGMKLVETKTTAETRSR